MVSLLLGTVLPYWYIVSTTGDLQIHEPLQCCTVRAGDAVPAHPRVPARHAYIYGHTCVYRTRFAGSRGLFDGLDNDGWVGGWGLGRVSEPALRWKGQGAERIMNPAVLSALPALTAEPQPSKQLGSLAAPLPALHRVP